MIGDCFQFNDDLVSFSIYFRTPNDETFDRAMGFCMHLADTFQKDWLGLRVLGADYSMFVSDALNVAQRGWKWNMPFILNPFWEHFFPAGDNAQQGLQPLYKNMAKGLREEIEKLQTLGSPIPIVIPPIPAVALERSSGNPSQYWKELKGVREEFTKCRKKFADLYERCASPTEDLGSLIQARREMIDEVQTVVNQVSKGATDGRLLTEFWDAVGTVEKSGQPVEFSFSASANIKGIVAGLLKWFTSIRIKRRARALFDLYGKSLRIRNYATLVSPKIAKLESRDIQALEAHTRRVESLIHPERKS